jgi:GxxExxY protein
MEKIMEVIRDCATRVYETLGCGYSEAVYHKAMEVEFRLRGISYETKSIQPILYFGYHIGHGEADLIVFDESGPQVIVELKAVTAPISRPHVAQLETYLRSRSDVPSGIIVNFRQPCNSTTETEELSVDFLELRRGLPSTTGVTTTVEVPK